MTIESGTNEECVLLCTAPNSGLRYSGFGGTISSAGSSRDASFQVYALDACTLLWSAAALRVCSVQQAETLLAAHFAARRSVCGFPWPQARISAADFDLYSHLKTTSRFSRLPMQNFMAFGLAVLLRGLFLYGRSEC